MEYVEVLTEEGDRNFQRTNILNPIYLRSLDFRDLKAGLAWRR